MDKPHLDTNVIAFPGGPVMSVADTISNRAEVRVLCYWNDKGVDRYQWFDADELEPSTKRKKKQ